MTQDFYTSEEAQQKLGMSEADLRNLTVEGKLREFRQEGQVLFRREDVDALTAEASAATGGSGELTLEPAEGPPGEQAEFPAEGLDLTGGGDLLSLAEEEEEPKPSEGEDAKKDDTVITSIGVNVFDGEELELEADPGAKTVLSESDGGGLAADSGGSGSGLLDLTRESDDTSLGAELLDEIYPSEGGAGDSTKAGLLQEMAGGSGTKVGGSGAGAGSGSEAAFLGASGAPGGTGQAEAAARGSGSGTATGTALEEALAGAQPAPAAEQETFTMEAARMVYAADPYGGMFTGVMLVTIAVLALAGAVCAAFMRGAWPTYLDWLGANLVLFGAGALGLTVIVLGVGFFVARPSAPSVPKAKKEKKPKEKKEKRAEKQKKEKK